MDLKITDMLFSTEMFQAIRSGNKTTTRRVVKLKPGFTGPYWTKSSPKQFFCYDEKGHGGNKLICPYGEVGDILIAMEEPKILLDPSPYPSESSRPIDLVIKGIRIERLQDISEKSAISEGVQRYHDSHFYVKYGSDNDWCASARASFAYLWESIKGTEAWNENPYVWVIDFQKI